MDSISKITFENTSFRIQNWVLVPASVQLYMLCSFQNTFQHLDIYAYFSVKRSTEMHFFCFYCVFPVLPFIFTVLISNTYVVLKYVGTESVPCHIKAKMFQNLFFLKNVMLVCIVK